MAGEGLLGSLRLLNPRLWHYKGGVEGHAENLSVPVELMFLGLIVIAAHAFQLVFKRYRIPDNLWLIGIGLVMGPLFGWVSPDDFGIVGEVLTAVALAVILFEAGLEIDLAEVRPALKGLGLGRDGLRVDDRRGGSAC